MILARAALLVGHWGWPIALLNVVMIASALVVGGHYLDDIIAGCVVAWFALRIANLSGR